MTRKHLLCLSILLACGSSLFSQAASDNTDQMFQDNPPDAAQQPQPPSTDQAASSTPPTQPAEQAPPSLVDQFTVQPGIQLRGSYSGNAGFLLGWAQRPDLNDLGSGFSRSPVFGMALSLSFEARPNASFRVLGTLLENYPNASTSPVSYTDVTPPTIAELFCDYSISDLLFLRIGKQFINWGASRFFPIDNLPGRVSNRTQPYSEGFDNSAGIAVKLTVPLGVHSLSGIAQIKNNYFQVSSIPHLQEVGYGLMTDWVLGNADISLGGYYQKYLAPRALLIGRATVFGIDARAGAIVESVPAGGVSVSGLANAYWEQADVGFHVALEYIYNADQGQGYTPSNAEPGASSVQTYGIGNEPGYPTGHAVEALAGFKNIFGTNIDIGVQWEHVFIDGSGVVIPAVVFRPFELMTLTVGVPIYYGSPTSTIMGLNPDPDKRQTAFGLKLDISDSF